MAASHPKDLGMVAPLRFAIPKLRLRLPHRIEPCPKNMVAKGGFIWYNPVLTVMSSAKLQVRPILLKKISLMIFFNNYLSDLQ